MVRKITKKLKKKWGISSNLDFILILVVFSLAGMGAAMGRKPIFALIGITADTPFWIKVCVYIPLIVPLYQISLLFFALLLGQFPFFWKKQKHLGRVLKRLVIPGGNSPAPAEKLTTHTTSHK